jgi:transketolase
MNARFDTTPAGHADLAWIARRLRGHVLRQATARRSHIGSALSIIEILTCLYFGYLRVDRQTIHEPDRDRFILSKGHGALGLYAALHEAGILPAGMLAGYGSSGNPLGGHPSSKIPGVELGTGALGHGLAVGAGIAVAARVSGWASRVVVLMGDGELDEGAVWEAALFAAHRQLGNLVAIIDRNGLQQEGATEDILALEPLADKWRAFGWHTLCSDGHDMVALSAALAGIRGDGTKPTVLIARTVKGKGVSFMEGAPQWHMAALDREHFKLAMAELEAGA